MCVLFVVQLAFGLGSAFRLREDLAFGLMAIGSSPGGGPSNMLTLLCDGEVDLSIAMTLCNSIAAIGRFIISLDITLTLFIVGGQSGSVCKPSTAT